MNLIKIGIFSKEIKLIYLLCILNSIKCNINGSLSNNTNRTESFQKYLAIFESLEDQPIPDEQNLISRLLFNYEPSARPVFNASKPIVVNFGLSLIQICDLVKIDYFFKPFLSNLN